MLPELGPNGHPDLLLREDAGILGFAVLDPSILQALCGFGEVLDNSVFRFPRVDVGIIGLPLGWLGGFRLRIGRRRPVSLGQPAWAGLLGTSGGQPDERPETTRKD